MSSFAVLPVSGDPAAAFRLLLRAVLESGAAKAVLAMAPTDHGPLPMPTLFTDPDALDAAGADPLAPAAPFNAARQAASLARVDPGEKIAVVLRPCELRALVELAKLRQCELSAYILISCDCPGRMENEIFLQHVGNKLTAQYLTDDDLQAKAARTCNTCEQFTPQGADLSVQFFGQDPCAGLTVEGGAELLDKLELAKGQPVPGRDEAIAARRQARAEAKSRLLDNVKEQSGDVAGLQQTLSACITCYNCRTACPVCYCRDCVFNSDVFRYEPEDFMRRAGRRGKLKLPPDTTMYHLTRMAHMAHACVGCGQCSSVCPSHIPVADLFRTAAARVQAAYDYEPGRDAEEPIPYQVFEAKE